MPFQKAKIYHDGSHYIAIPAENFPRNYKRRKTAFLEKEWLLKS